MKDWIDSLAMRLIALTEKSCPTPPIPPRLGEIVTLVASFVGYLGRKHDGPPSRPKAMWIGLQRL
jgi:hypothetical protein